MRTARIRRRQPSPAAVTARHASRRADDRGQKRRALPAHCAQLGLVLQGGGALGAYQAGVYQALAEHGYLPHWIAGISIGAINGAIIAGIPREGKRCPPAHVLGAHHRRACLKPLLAGDWARGIFNELSALATSPQRASPGFFRPRLPPVVAAALGHRGRAQLSTIPRRCARRWRSSSTSICSTAGPCG